MCVCGYVRMYVWVCANTLYNIVSNIMFNGSINITTSAVNIIYVYHTI